MDDAVSDLVRDWKLESAVGRDYTTHIKYVSDPATGAWRTPVEERWKRHEEEIGRGSYGVVWLEHCVSGPSLGKARAVKQIYTTYGSVTISHKDMSRELSAIMKFSHEAYRDCFVQSFGWYESNSSLFIAMEHLPLGDLSRYLKKPLPEPQAKRISLQIMHGLDFMHKSKFAHRDLKPTNILVQHGGPNWWVKISDFGTSKQIETTAIRTSVGTELYQAPEVCGIYCLSDLENEEPAGEFSLAVDIWSVGALTFRIATSRLPFASRLDLFRYVVRNGACPTEDSLSEEFNKFIQEMMAASPRQRPNTPQALTHTWLKIPASGSTDYDQRSSMASFEPSSPTSPTASQASATWSSDNDSTMRMPAVISTSISDAGDINPIYDTAKEKTMNCEGMMNMHPERKYESEISAEEILSHLKLDSSKQILLKTLIPQTIHTSTSTSSPSPPPTSINQQINPDSEEQKSTDEAKRDGFKFPISQKLFTSIQNDIFLVFQGFDSRIRTVELSPNGYLVAINCSGVHVWVMDHDQNFQWRQSLPGLVSAFSSNSELLILSSDASITQWEIDTKGQFQKGGTAQFPNPGNSNNMSLSAHGEFFMLHSYRASTSEHEMQIFRKSYEARYDRDYILNNRGKCTVLLSPFGETFAYKINVREVDIWRRKQSFGSFDPLQKIQETSLGPFDEPLAFSPNGRWLLLSVQSGIRVLEADSSGYFRQASTQPLDHQSGIECQPVFSRESTRLATVPKHNPKMIIIWDVDENNFVQRHKLRCDHADAVRYLSFSAYGNRLASAHENKTVVLWDIPS